MSAGVKGPLPSIKVSKRLFPDAKIGDVVSHLELDWRIVGQGGFWYWAYWELETDWWIVEIPADGSRRDFPVQPDRPWPRRSEPEDAPVLPDDGFVPSLLNIEEQASCSHAPSEVSLPEPDPTPTILETPEPMPEPVPDSSPSFDPPSFDPAPGPPSVDTSGLC